MLISQAEIPDGHLLHFGSSLGLLTGESLGFDSSYPLDFDELHIGALGSCPGIVDYALKSIFASSRSIVFAAVTIYHPHCLSLIHFACSYLDCDRLPC